MTTNEKNDKKYDVLLLGLIVVLVVGSIMIDFNYLDVAYLLFIFSCMIRYIYVKKHE